MTQAALDNPIVLFDGVCNLCTASVVFVIKRDRRAQFRFASLQSSAAQALLEPHHYDPGNLDSMLLIVDGTLYGKSAAWLQIMRRLDRAWPILFGLFRWVPTGIADAVYDFVGRRRYRWFGHKDSCWVPGEDLAQRFIV